MQRERKRDARCDASLSAKDVENPPREFGLDPPPPHFPPKRTKQRFAQ